MFRLFAFLFSGCFHIWEQEERKLLVETPESLPHGVVSYCKCTKCGVRKRFKMKN